MSTDKDVKQSIDASTEAIERIDKTLSFPGPVELARLENRLLIELGQVRAVLEAAAVLGETVREHVARERRHGRTNVQLITGALRLKRALGQLGHGAGLSLEGKRRAVE